MAKEPTIFKPGMSSVIRLDVSGRDLVRLRDLIDYLEASIRILGADRSDTGRSERIADISRESARLKSLFNDLFGDQIQGLEKATAGAEISVERTETVHAHTPEQVTLGMSEVTREQMLSVMDAIKKVSEEAGGHASKEAVLARAEEIGIGREGFEEILARLRRDGALVESEGTIRLV